MTSRSSVPEESSAALSVVGYSLDIGKKILTEN